MQNLPPCLTGNFGFTGGGGRGEGRREAEGAGKPAGAGSRAEPGQPGGSEAEGSARISPAPAAPRCAPPAFVQVVCDVWRRAGHRGSPEESPSRVEGAGRGGICVPPPTPRTSAKGFVKEGTGLAPGRGSGRPCTPKRRDVAPPSAPQGCNRGMRGREDPVVPPGAAPRGLRGCHSPPGNPACPPGINSLVLINKCISPS